MKLLSLTADRRSFRAIAFNPAGLSVIVGDAGDDTGSSNGTGKTLALALVHHCLAGKTDPLLAAAVPDWRFRLRFELGGAVHEIERSGDGRTIALDGAQTTLRKLQAWLDEHGPFDLEGLPGGSFRALYRRFARLRREDRTDPVRLDREPDHQALAYSLHLLGLDVSLVASKADLREEHQRLDVLAKALKAGDPALRRLLGVDVAPQTTLATLDAEIKAGRARLEAMEIAPDYEAIRREADALTARQRALEEQIAILDHRLAGIDDALRQRPDIDREALLAFYAGLQDVFKPEALRHFEDVESFHRSLASRRRERLERDRARYRTERATLERQHREAAEARDRALARLAGRHAMEEYAAVAARLAALEEDRRRLEAFINAEADIKRRQIELRTRAAEEDARAAQYLDSRPLAWADTRFREIMHRLYPQEAAGIVLENNTGPNRLRYDLRVEVRGQASDGINAARIIAFDWLVYTRGAHHTMHHLWHDNGLFDPIDPHQRAAWFGFVRDELAGTGRQYIVAINTENYDSTRAIAPAEIADTLEAAVVVRLRGDAPEGRLLGVQFGRPSR